MNWKDQLDKAISTVKDAAESESARSMASKAKQTAITLLGKARAGALDVAQSFVEANADPAACKCQYHNARFSVMAPSSGLNISTPSEGTIVIADGEENAVVLNAAAKPAYVLETIGQVTQVSANAYDLGLEDGINLVLIDS